MCSVKCAKPNTSLAYIAPQSIVIEAASLLSFSSLIIVAFIPFFNSKFFISKFTLSGNIIPI